MTTARENPAAAIGRRLKRYRLASGIPTAKELAERIGHPKLTVAVVQNIEAGRKVDIAVWQLLELAAGLRISPMLLLVDIDRGDEPVSIENAPSVPRTVDDFDDWWSMERPLRLEVTLAEALDRGEYVEPSRRDQLVVDSLRRRREAMNHYFEWSGYAESPEARPRWLSSFPDEEIEKNRDRHWTTVIEEERRLARWGVTVGMPLADG